MLMSKIPITILPSNKNLIQAGAYYPVYFFDYLSNSWNGTILTKKR